MHPPLRGRTFIVGTELCCEYFFFLEMNHKYESNVQSAWRKPLSLDDCPAGRVDTAGNRSQWAESLQQARVDVT